MKSDLKIKKYPVAVYSGSIWAGNDLNGVSFITTCGAISTLNKPKNQ